MLSKPIRQIIIAAGKSAGIPLQRISAAIAVMDHGGPDHNHNDSLLVTQATAAKLLAVSRFTVRRMVADRVLHPIKLRGAIRYSRCELERIAGFDPVHGVTIPDPTTSVSSQHQSLEAP